MAYRPSVPQGWNRPPVVLPAGKFQTPSCCYLIAVWLLKSIFAFNKFASAFFICKLIFNLPEFSVVEDEAVENEITSIYTSQQNYLELIRNQTPSPPVIEYQARCGEVETNIYDEPLKELIVASDSKESTPEYQTVPVKTLINSYEQGKFYFSFGFRNYFGSFIREHKQTSNIFLLTFEIVFLFFVSFKRKIIFVRKDFYAEDEHKIVTQHN